MVIYRMLHQGYTCTRKGSYLQEESLHNSQQCNQPISRDVSGQSRLYRQNASAYCDHQRIAALQEIHWGGVGEHEVGGPIWTI